MTHGAGRWSIARRALAVIALVSGAYLLVLTWQTFYRFGFLGNPREPHEEIAFWYAFPGFQAGLLLGLLLALARQGIDRLLLVLNVVVWVAITVNMVIIVSSLTRGVRFS